ncbi:hypothetical protein G9C85_09210 [Halorubellus sp. JP-L1]|uniref:hypothetical protein n=1 Tax=Halorubellus sp. JP-L1 TaxID=2715753 RepID=UPI00140ACEB8|nr:hypothetical protein [Halorubellus sp. JP-L1]NHN41806.1 hypothetical protein [Halorubellus sp. JP-L1]
MRRRRFVTALGSLAGASSLAIGSGAFNFANVERSVSVAVADDRNAFLKLTQRGSGERSDVDGVPDTIDFAIPGEDEDEYPSGNPTDPEGLGEDSIYRFGEDAGHDETGLFGVTNQGTDPVEVYSTQAPPTTDVPRVTMYDVESGDLLTESSPSDPLGVGEQLLCGIELDTHGVDARSDAYELSLVINARVPGNS